jgi:cytochrome c oxidase subunit 3
MSNFFSVSYNKDKKNVNDRAIYALFCKEQFKYLKTAHSYHLVDPSPWPFIASLGGFMLTSGLVLYMHKFIGGWSLFITGFLLILYVMYTWWRDVIREATFEDQHSMVVQKGLRLGMILFIVSEIMFFFAFFWAFFHSSIAPAYNIGGVWPPKAISTINTYTVPLTNTFILLTSGATVTWAHHALLARAKKHTLIALIFTLILAILFTCLQGLEYVNAPFNISDGVYGSCFYMATGFHGFHGAAICWFRASRLNLFRLYTLYLIKQLTYLKTKVLREYSMLVKVRTILVNIDRPLIKLRVQMLRLLTNTGLPCLQGANINLYKFGFVVGRECPK